MDLPKFQFSITGILTLVVIIIYGIGSLYALVQQAATFTEFSAAFGPIVGAFAGYFLKGMQTNESK